VNGRGKDCHARNGEQKRAQGFSGTAWGQFLKSGGGINLKPLEDHSLPSNADRGLVILVHEEELGSSKLPYQTFAIRQSVRLFEGCAELFVR